MTQDATRRTGMSIGSVLRALQPEFPDLSISKIRFLESKGLVSPQRSGSGYRYFTQQDVERLAYILRAQRDRFWPLHVIRDALDAFDRGLHAPDAVSARPVAPSVGPDPAVPDAATLGAPVSEVRLTAAELRESSGLGEGQLSALMEYGLVTSDAQGHFDQLDLAVATEAAALASHGLEARHLRPFRMAADREVGLVAQALSPRNGRPDADQALAEILSHCIALHVALVRAGLAEIRTRS